ncbi:MAG: COG2426 family protein [Nanoarchaeota archaeon]
MNKQILISILLSVLPITELRGGLPVILDYAIKNNQSIWPYFLLVISLNILIIFLVFLFLDYLHEHFMKIKFYNKVANKYLERIRRKSEEVNKKLDSIGYLALAIFVGIPLPGTGAWTGVLIAWFLNLDRKKSIFAISAGVIIAGFVVLFLSLGFFRLFNQF